MIFEETPIKEVVIIVPEQIEDERGFFARVWCKEEFEARGLIGRIVQCNVSYSKRTGTLRGLHYQSLPYQEAKIIRCIRGAIYDVVIDLRPGSPTYKQWLSVELTANGSRMLYVPEGFAHGFQTLADDTEVFYPVSQRYIPEAERGIRWNDPAFAITWPETGNRIISDKDKSWPDFSS